ncbi:MAG: DinB family protein [Leeuwenhoekiella sp.]
MGQISGMDFTFEVTLKNRETLERFLNTHTLEELNKVAAGFNNNIFWNIAHTIVVQQLLTYKLSGLTPTIPQELIPLYSNGTKPEKDVTLAEVDKIKSLLHTSVEKTRADYKNGVFTSFTERQLSTGNVLTSIEEAITFNNYHEGLHLGYILALRRAINL